MNEHKELDDFEPHARPTSRRISFCPTCGRPFLRGLGVWPQNCGTNGGSKNGPAKIQAEATECPEYCSEECLPGLLA